MARAGAALTAEDLPVGESAPGRQNRPPPPQPPPRHVQLEQGLGTDDPQATVPGPSSPSSPQKHRPKITRDAVLFQEFGTAAAQVYNKVVKYKDLEDIYKRWERMIPQGEMDTYVNAVKYAASQPMSSEKQFEAVMHATRRKFKIQPKRSQMLYLYTALSNEGLIPRECDLKHYLVKKASKSQSGVLVITVLTSPYPKVGEKVQRFSCQWNCYYCPNQPGQPRSYLHDEPAVQRANLSDFDPVMQFTDRCVTLAMNGHPVDKIELLVLGGTWASYPHRYQEDFIRDLFFAANTFHSRSKRPKRSLLEEKTINEKAQCKIIGVTLETRPDTINADELIRMRMLGCTRVQLGIQHTKDRILDRVNRGHGRSHAVRAIRLLKEAAFKVDIHLMPVLPDATVEDDREMFMDVLYSPDLQADQWKIYPCEITPWTVIKKWFEEGSYVPYPSEQLSELLCEVKPQVHPWIRLNRVIRDIPNQYILGGAVVNPNMREEVLETMARRGLSCRCIRCREIKGDFKASQTAALVHRTYAASGGMEHFLSFETEDRKKICAFLRLRLNKEPPIDNPFSELEQTALIREVHVYGQLIATSDRKTQKTQHFGFGRQLLRKAEELARREGYHRIAVIAGVGSREYYRKFGYQMEGQGEYLVKLLPRWWSRIFLSLGAVLGCGLLALAFAVLVMNLDLSKSIMLRSEL